MSVREGEGEGLADSASGGEVDRGEPLFVKVTFLEVTEVPASEGGGYDTSIAIEFTAGLAIATVQTILERAARSLADDLRASAEGTATTDEL